MHYFTHHKNSSIDPMQLLRFSKRGFDINIGKHVPRKDIEEHPKVVYLNPELQAIIDYKDSLITQEQFCEERVSLNEKLGFSHRAHKKHVSRRFCGNLTAFGRQNVKQTDENIQDFVQNDPNSRDTKLCSKGTLLNLVSKEDAPTDSDPITADLQLIKRDIDTAPRFARKSSENALEADKIMKTEVRHTGDKRVSRRCANLA